MSRITIQNHNQCQVRAHTNQSIFGVLSASRNLPCYQRWILTLVASYGTVAFSLDLPSPRASLTPSPTSLVPQPLSQPVAYLTPSLTLAVPSPTSLVPQPWPSLTPSPTSPEIQTLPQSEPSTIPITTCQSQPVLSFRNIPLPTPQMGEKVPLEPRCQRLSLGRILGMRFLKK